MEPTQNDYFCVASIPERLLTEQAALPRYVEEGGYLPPSFLFSNTPKLVISVIDGCFPCTISQNSYSD